MSPPDDNAEFPTLSRPGEGNAAAHYSHLQDLLRLKKGERIGDFEILEEVGQGGMGVVYKAYEVPLKRVVALKVLRPEIFCDANAMKRFRREAILAANLSHPNIVPVFHVEPGEFPRYFTMEFVQGVSLRQKVEMDGPLQPEQAMRIGLQACEALRYAHAQGVIHRDIKPSNILLQNHVERVRITDFGIAQDTTGRLADLTETGQSAPGTVAFESPEQALGQKCDCRSDIYSLGMTLYYVLTGRVAYEGETRAQMVLSVKEHAPFPPSYFNREVDRAFDNLLLGMIAADRQDRPSTMMEVLGAIRRLSAETRDVSHSDSALQEDTPAPPLRPSDPRQTDQDWERTPWPRKWWSQWPQPYDASAQPPGQPRSSNEEPQSAGLDAIGQPSDAVPSPLPDHRQSLIGQNAESPTVAPHSPPRQGRMEEPATGENYDAGGLGHAQSQQLPEPTRAQQQVASASPAIPDKSADNWLARIINELFSADWTFATLSMPSKVLLIGIPLLVLLGCWIGFEAVTACLFILILGYTLVSWVHKFDRWRTRRRLISMGLPPETDQEAVLDVLAFLASTRLLLFPPCVIVAIIMAYVTRNAALYAFRDPGTAMLGLAGPCSVLWGFHALMRRERESLLKEAGAKRTVSRPRVLCRKVIDILGVITSLIVFASILCAIVRSAASS